MTTLGATPSTTTFPSNQAVGGSYKGGWYVGGQGVVADVVTAVNYLIAHRINIPRICTVDRIGCSCTTVAASSVVRLGIYTESTDGLPDALVLDAGTVNTASGTGAKEITIDQALTPGPYWLAAVAQVGTPTMSSWTSGAIGAVPSSSAYDAASAIGFKTTNTITGALPSTFVVDWNEKPIRVWLRYV